MRYERALVALKEMGRPVFQGGITSLLGLALLYAGASSYIFEVFAQLLGAVIVLGLLHAIFVLPVLLSLIGPGPVLVEEEPVADDTGDEEGGDELKVELPTNRSDLANAAEHKGQAPRLAETA